MNRSEVQFFLLALKIKIMVKKIRKPLKKTKMSKLLCEAYNKAINKPNNESIGKNTNTK